MSLKLSTSVAEPFGFISRHDSAIDLGPAPELGPAPVREDGEDDAAFEARATAWGAPMKAWRRPLDVARETGDYAPILKAGVRPLIFRLRPILASTWARLDRYTAGMPNAMHAQLLFRVAVVGLDGEVPMELYDARHAVTVDRAYPDLGPIRPECFVDAFTGYEQIIDEIAIHVVNLRRPPGN